MNMGDLEYCVQHATKRGVTLQLCLDGIRVYRANQFTGNMMIETLDYGEIDRAGDGQLFIMSAVYRVCDQLSNTP